MKCKRNEKQHLRENNNEQIGGKVDRMNAHTQTYKCTKLPLINIILILKKESKL